MTQYPHPMWMENSVFPTPTVSRDLLANLGKVFLFCGNVLPHCTAFTDLPISFTPTLHLVALLLSIAFWARPSLEHTLFFWFPRAASIQVYAHSWVILKKKEREFILHPSNHKSNGHPVSGSPWSITTPENFLLDFLNLRPPGILPHFSNSGSLYQVMCYWGFEYCC